MTSDNTSSSSNAAENQGNGEEQPLLRENRGRVTILTLNRPRRRNGLSESLLVALNTAFADIAQSPDTHVVLLTGAAPSFCSGHDLKEITAHRADADGGHAFYERVMRLCAEVSQAITHCPQPVIAAVNGAASAAGCQLVASCDLAIASETAHFSTPGINIGFFCSTPMVATSRNISRKRALEMGLLGSVVPAMVAMQYGLVNFVTPEHEVMQEAMRWAGRIMSKPAHAIRRGKASFYRQLEMPLTDAYDYASRVMVEDLLSQDAIDGIDGFLQKRPTRPPANRGN
ncbi:MAG: enoyl-CoA hydratase [Alphaproteobacteria bacterium]